MLHSARRQHARKSARDLCKQLRFQGTSSRAGRGSTRRSRARAPPLTATEDRLAFERSVEHLAHSSHVNDLDLAEDLRLDLDEVLAVALRQDHAPDAGA